MNEERESFSLSSSDTVQWVSLLRAYRSERDAAVHTVRIFSILAIVRKRVGWVRSLGAPDARRRVWIEYCLEMLTYVRQLCRSSCIVIVEHTHTHTQPYLWLARLRQGQQPSRLYDRVISLHASFTLEAPSDAARCTNKQKQIIIQF